MNAVENTFESLLREHGGAVRLHCYRMLGSSHDSEDMVQETFVRAFRARDTLQHAGAARAWLYRIATNVCLDELRKRPPRARGPELGPPMTVAHEVPQPRAENEWIEPMPGAWIDGARSDPAATYSQRESVALAFVAALQVLTAQQRAVLLLRDVVGLSADETAKTLDITLSAANSTLHRARSALEERVGPRRSVPALRAEADRELLARYLRAWESGDLNNVVALLREDAMLSMPPIPGWIVGRQNILAFLQARQESCFGWHPIYARLAAANDGWALALYRGAPPKLFGLQLVGVADGAVHTLDQFLGESARRAFGLAPTL
jgi:RNA polymerase sigma-70 factor, ECF subfamily